MKSLFRRVMRIPPRDVSDNDIERFFRYIDVDFSGSLRVDEVISFLQEEGKSKVRFWQDFGKIFPTQPLNA